MSILVALFQQAQIDAMNGDCFAQEFISIIKRAANDFVNAFKSVDLYLLEWDYFEQFIGDVE